MFASVGMMDAAESHRCRRATGRRCCVVVNAAAEVLYVVPVWRAVLEMRTSSMDPAHRTSSSLMPPT
jgi:hypothetical protein